MLLLQPYNHLSENKIVLYNYISLEVHITVIYSALLTVQTNKVYNHRILGNNMLVTFPSFNISKVRNYLLLSECFNNI